MRSLIGLITLIALAFLPSPAIAHGGGYGGYHGCGGYYGGGCYGYFPFYASFSYTPYYYYPSYQVVYSTPTYYSSYPPAYAPASPADDYGYSKTAPTAPTTTSASAASTSAPMGKIDEFGYVHSPYSTSTFKVQNVADGQTFHDPITGQTFQVHTSKPSKAVAKTGFIPTGKLDEFGYVHSPYSTFTFKVQNSNYAQVFHDPLTGQPFVVAVRPGTPSPDFASIKTAD